METTFKEFRGYLSQVRDVSMAAAVLGWDREVNMPEGGAQARARQLGTLSTMAHSMFIDEKVGEWLEKLAPYEASLDYDSDEASLIRVMRRDYDKQKRVPSELVGEMARAASMGQQAWDRARKASDFSLFQPSLEQLIDLRIRWAECFDYEDNIYDPMLDDFEPGLTTAQVSAIFDEFRPKLVELVAAIAEQQDRVDASCLVGDFDVSKQMEVGIEALNLIGYDFHRGRQDRSAHPFTVHFSCDDVRITNRFDPNNIFSGLSGSIHEGGHALYELGVSPNLDDTLLGEGASMTLHESQSRLFENLVGRSRPFWRYFYPRLQARFPQFNDVKMDTFYRAINRVRPSLIRVDADEVTYGLHIILRFELEQAMVNGQLKAADLPRAWNDRMESYLGVTPPNDALGVLQDIHWSGGMIGYFPDYLLGSMLSVQIFNKMMEAIPDLVQQIEKGELGQLLDWLRENVHRHGRKYTLAEMTDRMFGAPLSSEPYFEYLSSRYGEIYGL
ncbi:MAG: carboxypeptidase M32 [Anaerolineales bacterium]|nr:carboxypeptidase M32 [Anaerolineales bacterium]